MSQGVEYGNYFLLGRLESNDDADSFLARRRPPPESTQLFVFKRLKNSSDQDSPWRDLFMARMKDIESISHPNFCNVSDYGEVSGNPFVVTDFIHGKELEKIIHRLESSDQLMEPTVGVFLVKMVSQGLDAFHKALETSQPPSNCAYGSITPTTIIVDYNGRPALINFALDLEHKAIQTGHPPPKGEKALYLSPEQARGAPPSKSSDIFSLGLASPLNENATVPPSIIA